MLSYNLKNYTKWFPKWYKQYNLVVFLFLLSMPNKGSEIALSLLNLWAVFARQGPFPGQVGSKKGKTATLILLLQFLNL